MRDLIIELLGEYTPTLTDDGQMLGGLASLDFTWLCGAACFVIMLIGVLGILRTMMKGIFG